MHMSVHTLREQRLRTEAEKRKGGWKVTSRPEKSTSCVAQSPEARAELKPVGSGVTDSHVSSLPAVSAAASLCLWAGRAPLESVEPPHFAQACGR